MRFTYCCYVRIDQDVRQCVYLQEKTSSFEETGSQGDFVEEGRKSVWTVHGVRLGSLKLSRLYFHRLTSQLPYYSS